jgi:hypothetical protein
VCSLQEVGHSEVHMPAAASRTTGSAHAVSLFFTRLTRLFTSYCRINAGLNRFCKWQSVSGFDENDWAQRLL